MPKGSTANESSMSTWMQRGGREDSGERTRKFTEYRKRRALRWLLSLVEPEGRCFPLKRVCRGMAIHEVVFADIVNHPVWRNFLVFSMVTACSCLVYLQNVTPAILTDYISSRQGIEVHLYTWQRATQYLVTLINIFLALFYFIHHLSTYNL